jgi:hypothetical protein
MISTILQTNPIFLPEISHAAGNFGRGSLASRAVKLLKMLVKAACKGFARGSKCIHRASLKKRQAIQAIIDMREITLPEALGVAVQDLDEAGGGVDAQHVAGEEELRHVAGETVDQGHAAKGRTLGEDRVDLVEDQRPRHDPARPHVVQHPGGGDPSLGTVEDEDAVDIVLAGELVARAREGAANPVEIVACAEIVSRDEGDAAHLRADAVVAAQQNRHYSTFPTTADSMHRSRLARLDR